MAITTEDDPTPLVLVFANLLRRSAAADPGRMAKLKGVAAVRSLTDPQAVTLRFADGDVHVEHGIAADAGVTVGLDFDRDGLPDAPAPQVTGAMRHPRLALGLAKVLDPPMPDLHTAAEAFWRTAHAMHGMPSGLRLHASDTRATAELGDDVGEVYEVMGPEDRLVRILTGQTPALVEVMEGRCQVRGSLAVATAVTRATVLVGIDDGRSSDGADRG